MSRADREAETRGYHVPDTRDVPKVWADGPHKGKRVGSTPVKVRSLKLDPVESEARAEASRLARIGSLGKLELEAQHAQAVANLKMSAYEVAYSFQQNPWLRQEVVPKSKLPMIALVTFLGLLAAMQFALFFQSQRPTLPEPRTASEAPQGGEEVAEHKQGRAH